MRDIEVKERTNRMGKGELWKRKVLQCVCGEQSDIACSEKEGGGWQVQL